MTELHSLKASDGLDWSSSPPNGGLIATMHGSGGHFDGAIGAGGPAAAAPSAPGATASGGIGSFFSSPFASVGVEYGKTLLKSNPVLNSGVGGWLRGSRLRYYFQVEQMMLLRKVGKILFPFVHYDWARKQGEEQEPDVERAGLLADGSVAIPAPTATFQPPSKDINAPDLYIGTMAFINFVVTMGFALGSVNAFDPQSLGLTATRSLVCLLFEVGCIYALFYLHDAPHSPPVIDLLCLCCYKYVALNLDIIIGLLFGPTIFWIAFLALAVSTAIFMVRQQNGRGNNTSIERSCANNHCLPLLSFLAVQIRTLNGWLPQNAAALGTSPNSPRFRTMLAVAAVLQLAFSLFLLYPALRAVHSSSGLQGLRTLVPAMSPKSSAASESLPTPATPSSTKPVPKPSAPVAVKRDEGEEEETGKVIPATPPQMKEDDHEEPAAAAPAAAVPVAVKAEDQEESEEAVATPAKSRPAVVHPTAAARPPPATPKVDPKRTAPPPTLTDDDVTAPKAGGAADTPLPPKFRGGSNSKPKPAALKDAAPVNL